MTNSLSRLVQCVYNLIDVGHRVGTAISSAENVADCSALDKNKDKIIDQSDAISSGNWHHLSTRNGLQHDEFEH